MLIINVIRLTGIQRDYCVHHRSFDSRSGTPFIASTHMGSSSATECAPED